jgi:predicted adenine nucleotide alpha hydrolase (AANH) superfamily ATPase
MGIKPSLLLHSCCGPCSTSVIERLEKDYRITVFYYNPNITDAGEYEKRKASQILFLSTYGIKQIDFCEGPYEPTVFLAGAEVYSEEPEGGKRCEGCFKLRLEKTAAKAQIEGYDFFGTTLTVSPHKNATLINKIGNDLAASYGVPFLTADFKKKDGYRRSIAMAEEYLLYRQNYCGCKYSIND